MFYLVWASVALLYAPILKILYRTRWETIDYTHAYFILPASLWLVWRQRIRLKELVKALSSPLKQTLVSTVFLCLFIFGLLMFLFGRRQDYLFISTLSLIPVLFGLTGYIYGTSVARTLSFPISYLLLLVPPPLGDWMRLQFLCVIGSRLSPTNYSKH